MDLSAIRRRLASLEGRTYWRSLEEAAEAPEFQDYLSREFPEHAATWTDPVGRRQFLKLMGASLALAGVGACTKQPEERIVPYVRAPEEIVPGKPLFYATAMPLGGIGHPILVESHMGRPTKIEGNPDHPESLGATDLYAQASVLNLYDPDRLQSVRFRGESRPWSSFLGAMQSVVAAQQPSRGAGLRILTESISSPSLAEQIRSLLSAMPAAKWHQYEPLHRDHVLAGSQLAFGRALHTQYRVDRADVILSLDADFLAAGPGHVRHAREFAARRRVYGDRKTMNRLYMVETIASVTGPKADHRLALAPREVEAFARATAAALGIPGVGAAAAGRVPQGFIPAVVADLRASRGRSLVIAGETQPPIVHALAHAMNRELGNVGQTVVYTEPLEAQAVDQTASLGDLVADMQAGTVELLVILGGNPVYDAPADLRFVDALQRVGLVAHLALNPNETSELCHWSLPEAHYLEAWGDVRAADGSVSIVQPLIAPLYEGKSAHEVLAMLSAAPDRSGHDIVKGYWLRALRGETTPPWTLRTAEGGNYGDAEQFWRAVLHDGRIHGTALEAIDPGPVADLSGAATPASGEGLELVFARDPSVYDGRFANNGWLQELSKPHTKITWDNVAALSPRTAEQLGVGNHQVVEITVEGRTARVPVWIVPGHADDAVSITVGYGRAVAGRVGHGVGANAYALRTSAAPWIAKGLQVARTGERHEVATTQHHFVMEGRHMVRAGTLTEYLEHPGFVKEMGETPPRTVTLYPEHEYTGYKWGMTIDLTACTGCNACVVACQAENNIAVVGKAQVSAGREMQWIRIDSYFEGDLDAPTIYSQPVPCMQCENAPCEPVCPVGATVHSSEGLNDMVYNRCVGTRYCSNNCPYKVRRFNFLLYQDFTTESIKLQRNPDVTVRSRGVMEKCTYCVQRISHARINAKKEGREIRDGEVVTACEQVCPSQAIVFGNLNDPESRVARVKAEQLNYGMLEELNTRPRTTYLAALRNPNPAIEEG
jgi:MoCo/4Fe-4S cofactor protein with predicted Tat translocation signal